MTPEIIKKIEAGEILVSNLETDAWLESLFYACDDTDVYVYEGSAAIDVMNVLIDAYKATKVMIDKGCSEDEFDALIDSMDALVEACKVDARISGFDSHQGR